MKVIKKISGKMKRAYNSYTIGDYMRTAYLSPRRVALITSRFQGKDNVLPVDWHMPLSFSPKLYCISLESGNYSSEMITASGCFAVNFMGAEYEEQIIACGKISGRNNDKFSLTGLGKIKAEKVDAPLIENALGWLECRLVNTVLTGDHTLFIGEVAAEKENEAAEEIYHITSKK